MSKCNCSKHDKCVRQIHSTKEGKLYIKTSEHFLCGDIQKQIEKLKQYELRNRN